MELKCFLSEASTELMQEALEEMRQWHYDAVNSVVLLSSLVVTEESYFKDYLIGEDVAEDEITDVISLNFSLKNASLKKGKEDKKGSKEEDKKSKSKINS